MPRALSKRDQSSKTNSTYSLKARKTKEVKRTNQTSLANYDEQQLKSRRHNAKKHNYTSAEDVPYGIQESCSHHPKNNLSVFTKEHRCPYCGNVLNGNQQQNQEKKSKIDKTSSVSELSDHNEMPTKKKPIL